MAFRNLGVILVAFWVLDPASGGDISRRPGTPPFQKVNVTGENGSPDVNIGNVNVNVNMIVNGALFGPPGRTTGKPVNGTTAGTTATPRPIPSSTTTTTPRTVPPEISTKPSSSPTQTSTETTSFATEEPFTTTEHSTSSPVPSNCYTTEASSTTELYPPSLDPITSTGCGGGFNITSWQELTITYPWQGQYRDNEECTWTISTGTEYMEIDVVSYSVENHHDGVLCYSYGSTSISTHRILDSDQGCKFRIRSPATCAFFTDGSVVSYGFTLKIIGVDTSPVYPIGTQHQENIWTRIRFPPSSPYNFRALGFITFQPPQYYPYTTLTVDCSNMDPAKDSLTVYRLEPFSMTTLDRFTGNVYRVYPTERPLQVVFRSTGTRTNAICYLYWYPDTSIPDVSSTEGTTKVTTTTEGTTEVSPFTDWWAGK